MIPKIELDSRVENLFTGMSNTLRLYQGGRGRVTKRSVRDCWEEANTDKQRAVVFSVFFCVGDITNRHHNIFEVSKRDSGGYANRESFRDIILPFMWSKVSESDKIDNIRFMDTVVEYTTMDNILATRVKTHTGKDEILQIINMVEVFGVDNVSDYCAYVYNNGTEFKKACLAKYLVLPKTGRQNATIRLQSIRRNLLTEFCKKVGLNYFERVNYTDFVGYRRWRKNYNSKFESVLFSTGGIKNISKEEFLTLIEHMPLTARFRVRSKLVGIGDTPKKEYYTDLASWYVEWEGAASHRGTGVSKKVAKEGVPTETDKFEPLQSIYYSNRYAEVRKLFTKI